AECLEWLSPPVLPHGEINAHRSFWELPGADLVSVGPRLDAQAALKPAVLIKAEHQRGLVVDNAVTRQLDQVFQGRIEAQRLDYHLIMVAGKRKVEGE